MGYFNDSAGCGPACGCSSCSASRGLGERYYQGEGGDSPNFKGLGYYGLGEAAPTGTVTRDIKIVAKSYIAPIRSAVGSPYCGGLMNPVADLKLRALAYATDAAFSENPLTDLKDKIYRLYSARTFTVTCSGGSIVSVVPSGIDTDAGRECIPSTTTCLQPPALTLSGVAAAPMGSTYGFEWTARGRPHLGAEPAFQAVCPRTSVYIWHRISGRIACVNGEPRAVVSLTGSQFPSHRAWINGRLQPPTVPQGPFSNLWVPAGVSDPLRVR